MSKTSEPILEFSLTNSRLLLFYIAFIFFVLLVSVWFSPLSLVAKAGLLVTFLLLGSYYAAGFISSRSKRFVRRFSISSDQQACLYYVDGRKRKATLTDTQILFGNAVILKFHIKKMQYKTLLLLADNSSDEERRQLRVYINQKFMKPSEQNKSKFR